MQLLSALNIESPYNKPRPERLKYDTAWRFISSMVKAYVYILALLTGILLIPNRIWDEHTVKVALVIGVIGIWRYSWWMVNLGRAIYFGNVMYPKMRAKADKLWQTGWRPNHLHILMVTFNERPEITEQYLSSLLSEVEREKVPATLWVGSGARIDEVNIRNFAEQNHSDYLKIKLIYQKGGGKRIAIGLLLRALSRYGITKDDVAVLMDGDSILGRGCLQKCLSIMGAFPRYKALTTYEEVIAHGPEWVALWLKMRFFQRQMWMQSHAVSHKVITLTGRMSCFRAENIVREDFIRTVEADHLEHWLWGQFRFLSGDDKSTWYALLCQGVNMTYVPDALVYTIEHIEGNGFHRMKENLMRWSGNMLRNGSRAISLGPKRVGWFIWWVLVDQRISIWTNLFSLTTAILSFIFLHPLLLGSYIIWIAASRFMMCLPVFFYGRAVYLSFPLLLYFNQLVGAVLKAYLIFRLPRQRWANRSNQRSGQDVMSSLFRRTFATYVNFIYIGILALIVCLSLNILDWRPGLWMFG
jgi:glycosyltransferase Alg8